MELTLIQILQIHIYFRNTYVSILVLMELTLIHKMGKILSKNLKSFNPCFNGTYSYTKYYTNVN